MSINFITDFSLNTGLGNFFRSKEIFEKAKLSHDCNFIILSKSKKINCKANLAVLDLPNRKYDIKKIKNKYLKKNGKVVALDYNHPEKIDVNIGLLKKSKKAKKNYVSLKYIIIRKKFLKLKKKNIQLNLK